MSILHVRMQTRCEMKATEIETFLSSGKQKQVRFCTHFFSNYRCHTFESYPPQLVRALFENVNEICFTHTCQSEFFFREGEKKLKGKNIERDSSCHCHHQRPVFYAHLHKTTIHLATVKQWERWRHRKHISFYININWWIIRGKDEKKACIDPKSLDALFYLFFIMSFMFSPLFIIRWSLLFWSAQVLNGYLE